MVFLGWFVVVVFFTPMRHLVPLRNVINPVFLKFNRKCVKWAGTAVIKVTCALLKALYPPPSVSADVYQRKGMKARWWPPQDANGLELSSLGRSEENLLTIYAVYNDFTKLLLNECRLN